MAINYSPVGWDPTKFYGPTNMNHMDDGIKAACDKVDELDANKLDKTGDSTDNTVTFSSGDSTSPTGWANIVTVASGETHKSLFRKFSLAVKNLRYLYKMLGSTDISAIGDGTATGAIATINSNLLGEMTNIGNYGGYIKVGKIVTITAQFNLGTISADQTILATGLPTPIITTPYLMSKETAHGAECYVLVNSSGELILLGALSAATNRLSISGSYICK